MKRKYLVIIVLICSLFLVSGCGKKNEKKHTDNTIPEKEKFIKVVEKNNFDYFDNKTIYEDDDDLLYNATVYSENSYIVYNVYKDSEKAKDIYEFLKRDMLKSKTDSSVIEASGSFDFSLTSDDTFYHTYLNDKINIYCKVPVENKEEVVQIIKKLEK